MGGEEDGGQWVGGWNEGAWEEREDSEARRGCNRVPVGALVGRPMGRWVPLALDGMPRFERLRGADLQKLKMLPKDVLWKRGGRAAVAEGSERALLGGE